MKLFMQYTLFLFICLAPFLCSAQKNTDYVRVYLEQFQNENKIESADRQWVISSDFTSSMSKVRHIYFNQAVHDIPIKGTESSIHISSENQIISSNNKFLKNFRKRSIDPPSPSLSAVDAIRRSAFDLGYTSVAPVEIKRGKTNLHNDFLFRADKISLVEVPVSLVYQINDKNKMVLVWKILISTLDYQHHWEYSIAAHSGAIISKIDRMLNNSNNETCATVKEEYTTRKEIEISNHEINSVLPSNCTECYEVIEFPLESPYYGERTIVESPYNPTASPFGWHDTNGIPGPEYLVTTGNNVEAKIGNPEHFGFQPNGGQELDFTGYPFDQDVTAENLYEKASLTNLFYWCNTLHDKFYTFGFDEQAGNFQENNYGKGGFGGDSVMAMGQNELNHCNGNFSITKDGVRPLMRMNICRDKDGSFDNIVSIHEYSHGVTIRSVGGPMNPSCLFNAEQMGEGWSDWYGVILTMVPGDVPERPRTIATYLKGTGPDGQGVRAYPYTTDMAVNPLTYDSIKENDAIHHIGTVWATMLWEMTWELIANYGFDPNIDNFTGDINSDAGNVMAMAIVTEALKFTPCRPGFVDARDAIFQASKSIYGLDLDCVLWNPFAKRGLGFLALQGDSNSVYDGTESFIVPPRIAEFVLAENNFCIDSGVQTSLSGGSPRGGVYSGPGITDDGNGDTYTLDPEAAGIGTHTVSYEIFDSACTDASIAQEQFVVRYDSVAPEIYCPDNIVINLPEGVYEYEVPNYIIQYPATDDCSIALTMTQVPVIGSFINPGIHQVVLSAVDHAGNDFSCSFKLSINAIPPRGDDGVVMYPVPADEELLFNSINDIPNLTITLFDINGRLIETIFFEHFGFSNKISLTGLASGMYFVKLDAYRFNSTYYFIKK